MADVRMAGAALLTTVAETANTVTNLVASIGTGAKMLNDFTSSARDNQLINIKLSKVGYIDRLKTTKTIEIDTSRQALEDYVAGDQAKADRTKAIWAELEAALA